MAKYQYILKGLGNTLLIALGAVLLGVLLGVVISVIRNLNGHTGKLPILNLLAKGYVNIIRGTPVILQLMIIYYVIFANTSVNIILVGILAFGINSGAYVAEIIRGGLNSVDKGQMEAGYALGLNYSSVMRYIVFPPAIRNILPALGNEFITLVKETSIQNPGPNNFSYWDDDRIKGGFNFGNGTWEDMLRYMKDNEKLAKFDIIRGEK